jgi:hypothetical protein
MKDSSEWRIYIALASCALATAAGAGPMQPGMWEVLSNANIGGTSADQPTTRVCISSKEAADSLQSLPRPSPSCNVMNARTEGNKIFYEIECADKPAMRGRAELMATPNAYQGSVQMMIIQAPGMPDVPMRVTFAGRRLGDC